MSQNSQKLDQQLDAALVKEAMDLITSARRIALLAHEHPDGDCLGSALGLAHILRTLGKSCVPACADPPPPYLSFLPGSETFVTDLGAEDFDLVIALDAGDLYRFGPLSARHQDFLKQARLLNIDHHLGGNGCGQVNIIVTNAAATAEILLLFQQQAGLPLPTEAAVCLLTGLITDTGSFQYSNTTPRTLEVAAELMRHGAVPEAIIQPIYHAHSLAEMRFQAAIFEQATTACAGQLIWSWATSETLARTGNTADQSGNGSGLLRDIAGVQIAAFFKNYDDSPNTTRLSLRSAEPYNAAEICKRLSKGEGGGHARAAGATFYLPLQETMDLVIPVLEKELTGHA